MAGSIRVTMDVGADGVALITICNPPVNALHPIIIQGLKEKYAEAMDRDDVKAIVLTDGSYWYKQATRKRRGMDLRQKGNTVTSW